MIDKIYKEKDLQEYVYYNIHNILGHQYKAIMRECSTNLGIIDILAKNIENNKKVIIEVKYNIKSTNRINQQIIAYASCFDSPELFAVNSGIFTGFRLPNIQYIENITIE